MADEPRRITVDELKAFLDAGTPVQVLDVRADGAYQGSQLKIPGAIRIPPNDITAAAGLSRDILTVTYCT